MICFSSPWVAWRNKNVGLLTRVCVYSFCSSKPLKWSSGGSAWIRLLLFWSAQNSVKRQNKTISLKPNRTSKQNEEQFRARYSEPVGDWELCSCSSPPAGSEAERSPSSGAPTASAGQRGPPPSWQKRSRPCTPHERNDTQLQEERQRKGHNAGKHADLNYEQEHVISLEWNKCSD